MNKLKPGLFLSGLLISVSAWCASGGSALNMAGKAMPQNSSCVASCARYFYTDDYFKIIDLGPNGEITSVAQAPIPHGSKPALIIENVKGSITRKGQHQGTAVDGDSSHPLSKCTGRCEENPEMIRLETNYAFFSHDRGQIRVVQTTSFVGVNSSRVYNRKITEFDISADEAKRIYGYDPKD
ncbi:hypothetical protein [Salinisphaera sp. Q1T1-3]|uniref:hypothetical protein n=1 Tax=Salinisphaera sp. Q1T1-3 TaxID=2321229 RepID=UPI0011C3E595|nr:hypothetical protein [Salinisphaera sp. Q1T1-3]